MSFFRGVILLSLAFSLPLRAADWPQWRGPDRTAHVPDGEPVPTTLPSDPNILWHIKIGFGLASPVVANGKLFYEDDQNGQEVLHAVKVSDGSELWHTDIDEVSADNQTAPGPRCTPTADSDLIFAQSLAGELRCLKVADGSGVWSASFTRDFSAAPYAGENGSAQGASRHGNVGSPVVDGANLYVAVGGTQGDSVVCFEKTTGKVIWKSQNDPTSYASPIVTTIGGARQLVHFTSDSVIGLDLATGKLLWRSPPLKTSSARHATTPVVIDDTVVVGSISIGLVGLKISHTGDDWQAATAWQKKNEAMNFSTPVAVGGYLYGLGPQRNFICVDAKTGAQMWSHEGYVTGSAGNAYTSFIVMGANILALTDGGQLVLFAADPKQFKEIGLTQVCGKTWCLPAYADGKLYLRDARELMCVALAP